MLLFMILIILFGIILGFVSGLTPGLHLNLVSVIVVGFFPTLGLPVLYVFVLVMSLAVTHTIVDVLASTYLGVPDEQTIAGLLPAQQMVKDGRAHESIYFTIVGSVFSVFVCVGVLVCIYSFLEYFESFIIPFLGLILILTIGYLLWLEDDRLLCLCLFLISGIFGVLVLSIQTTSFSQPLLPLLGGLFGGAGLIETIRKNVSIPKQKKVGDAVGGKFEFSALFASALTGILAAFLPGIGSSQAAILAGRVVEKFGKQTLHAQLVLAGGINTVNMVFSIATWIALGKSRNGAVATLSALGEPTIYVGILLLIVCCVVSPFVGMITLFVSRRICAVFTKINYSLLALCILSFIVSLVVFIDGWLGLVVFVGACAIGSLCVLSGLPKHYLMGCLLLQVVVFFLQ